MKKWYLSLLMTACCITNSAFSAEEKMYEEVIETSAAYQVPESGAIEIENFIGKIVVEPSDEKIEVHSVTRASHSDEKRAREIAAKLQLKVEESSERLFISCEFPVNEHSIYHYPFSSIEKKGLTKGRLRTGYKGKEVTVFADNTPAAVFLVCDLTVKVPRGVKLKIKNEIGAVEIANVSLDAVVEGSSALQTYKECRGKFFASSLTGAIQVKGMKGQLSCYAGSGQIAAEKLEGIASMQTGAGTITVDESALLQLGLISGSGAITLDKVSAAELQLFTGSGKVAMEKCSITKSIKINTGSGSLKMKGDFSAVEALAINTGSGGVAFHSTPFPPLYFELFSAKGIKVAVPEMKAPKGTLHYFAGSVGDAVKGKATIRSGCGFIKLESKEAKPRKD